MIPYSLSVGKPNYKKDDGIDIFTYLQTTTKWEIEIKYSIKIEIKIIQFPSVN